MYRSIILTAAALATLCGPATATPKKAKSLWGRSAQGWLQFLEETPKNVTDQRVALRALARLHTSRTPDVVPALASRLGHVRYDDSEDSIGDHEVRLEAVFALAHIGTPAVPELLATLDSESEKARLHALDVLARIGRPAGDVEGIDVTARLTEIAADGGAGKCRAAAAAALIRITGDTVRNVPVIDAALDVHEDDISWTAIYAARRAGPAAAALVPKLQKYAEHEPWRERSLAALAGIVEDPSGPVGELVAGLTGDRQRRLRSKCGLMEAGDVALPLLRTRLEEAGGDEAVGIVQSIDVLGPAAMPLLCDALEHPDPKVAKAARGEFLAFKECAAATVPALLRLFEAGGDNRKAAITAACWLGEPGLSVLFAVADDPGDEIDDALYVSFRRAGSNALPGLSKRLRAKSPVTRWIALRGLQQLSEKGVEGKEMKRAAKAAKKLLKDKHSRVRSQAESTLEAIESGRRVRGVHD